VAQYARLKEFHELGSDSGDKKLGKEQAAAAVPLEEAKMSPSVPHPTIQDFADRNSNLSTAQRPSKGPVLIMISNSVRTSLVAGGVL
jgi:hypothetical protein